MALSVATEFIGEVEIDGRLKIKGEGKVFPNHTHVALSSSLTIFTLFFSFDSSGLRATSKSGHKQFNKKNKLLNMV